MSTYLSASPKSQTPFKLPINKLHSIQPQTGKQSVDYLPPNRPIIGTDWRCCLEADESSSSNICSDQPTKISELPRNNHPACPDRQPNQEEKDTPLSNSSKLSFLVLPLEGLQAKISLPIAESLIFSCNKRKSTGADQIENIILMKMC